MRKWSKIRGVMKSFSGRRTMAAWKYQSTLIPSGLATMSSNVMVGRNSWGGARGEEQAPNIPAKVQLIHHLIMIRRLVCHLLPRSRDLAPPVEGRRLDHGSGMDLVVEQDDDPSTGLLVVE